MYSEFTPPPVVEDHISKSEAIRFLNKLSQETDFRMSVSVYVILLSEIEKL